MENLATTLRTLLAHNIVSFTFRKVNGEIRHAVGTRNLALASRLTQTEIPTPKGEEQSNSYYDIEKMGWRSYKPENLISIDGCKIGWWSAETPKKGELPKREIPISKPMGGGADIDRFGFAGLFGGTFPKEEIRKSMEALGRDIDITPLGGKGGVGITTEKGLAVDTKINADDFARLVAKYVVDELVSRLTR
jgi:hypothetical protein